MRTIHVLPVLLAVAAMQLPAAADAELLLTDGTVLKGTEVKLEAGYYLLTLESGEVAAIPAALVQELYVLDLRTTEEGTTVGVATDISRPPEQQEPLSRFLETRPGWRRGAPRDLTGNRWRLHGREQQTAVLGEPSRFQRGLPFRFAPVHAWDRSIDVLSGSRSKWQRPILDPVWEPQPAFDPRADVLGDSRSTWPTAPRATTWNPSNSFSRVRADIWWGKDPFDAEPARERLKRGARFDWQRVADDCPWCNRVPQQPSTFTLPSPYELTAEHCARRLFGTLEDAETLQWAEVRLATWTGSPPSIYEAWTDSGTRAVFSIAAGSCRLIAGDLRELLGIDLTETDALRYAVSAWNDIQAGLPAFALVTATQQIDHVFAVVGLLETATSGRPRARMELLAGRPDVERWTGMGTACSKSKAFRRAQRGNVDRNFEAPRADVQPDWANVDLWVWLSRDGEVFAYDVRLFADGRVEMTREAIGEHLGEHEDSR